MSSVSAARITETHQEGRVMLCRAWTWSRSGAASWWQGLHDREVFRSSYLPDCLYCWTSGVTLPKTWSPFGDMVVVGYQLLSPKLYAVCPWEGRH